MYLKCVQLYLAANDAEQADAFIHRAAVLLPEGKEQTMTPELLSYRVCLFTLSSILV